MSHRRSGTVQSHSPQATFTAKMTSNQKTQTAKTAPQGSATVRTAVARARRAVSVATPHPQDVHLSRVAGGDTPSDPHLALGKHGQSLGQRPPPCVSPGPCRTAHARGRKCARRSPSGSGEAAPPSPRPRPHGRLLPPARAAGPGAAREAVGPDKAALSSRVP